MALILGVAPWAGAHSTAGPDASTWFETDSMGNWVFLAPPRDRCVNDSWIQSHLTFFRGGTGATMPKDPFDNAGVFTAVEDDTMVHRGQIWWIASGRTRLEPTVPDDPCNPEFGVPVQGSFRGKGALRITESEGDGPLRAGVMCSLTFATHLTAVAADPPAPPFQWTGNLVAHCDDGAKLHLDVLGPTGPGLQQPFGFDQIATGVIHDKSAVAHHRETPATGSGRDVAEEGTSSAAGGHRAPQPPGCHRLSGLVRGGFVDVTEVVLACGAV